MDKPQEILPSIPYRAVSGTNGKLAMVNVFDVIDFGFSIVDEIWDDLKAADTRTAQACKIYDSYALGHEVKGPDAAKDEQTKVPGFVDRGTPVRPDIDKDTRPEYNASLAEDLRKFADMNTSELYTLDYFTRIEVGSPSEAFSYEDLKGRHGINDKASCRALGERATSYLNGWNELHGQKLDAYDDAERAYTALKWGVMHDLDTLKQEGSYLIDALKKIIENTAEYSSQDALLVKTDSLIARQALYDESASKPRARVAIDLACTVLRSNAGTYDPGGLVLEYAPAGDEAYINALTRDLMQFTDTADLLERSKRHGVTLDVRNIPDELVDMDDEGKIHGALAAFEKNKNSITAFQPPSASTLITDISATSTWAHELRHAAHHFNNPELEADRPKGAQNLEGIAQELLYVKLVEADAKAFQTYDTYLRLSEGGNKTVEIEALHKIGNVFMQMSIVRFENRFQESMAQGSTENASFKNALRENFMGNLADQGAYEIGSGSFQVFLQHSDCSVIWAKTVAALAPEWVEKLTAVKSLGESGYMPATPDNMARLSERLLETSKRYAPTPEKFPPRAMC